MVRIGITLGHGFTPLELVRCARMAEMRGFHSLWVSETNGPDVLTALGGLAVSTGRLMLGSAIANAFTRSSVQIAMAAATIDELSGGRLLLGLGASTKVMVEDWHSMAYEAPLARIEGCVKRIRAILAGEDERFHLYYNPRRCRVPIFLACVGPKMVRLAARIAEGLILYMRPLASLKALVDSIRAEGRGEVEVACAIITSVDEDEEKAREGAMKVASFYIGAAEPYNKMLKSLGYKEEAERLWEAWHKPRREAEELKVSDELLKEVAIFGDEEECRRQLKRYINAGITLPLLRPASSRDRLAGVKRILEAFGED